MLNGAARERQTGFCYCFPSADTLTSNRILLWHALVSKEMMRTVGHRKIRSLTPIGSGALLAEGARFNDEIHRLPTGDRTFIRKGVYRFKTHEDANRHDEECLAAGMAMIASKRRGGH